MSERSLTHSRSDILKNLIKAVLGVESYRMVKIKFNEGKYEVLKADQGEFKQFVYLQGWTVSLPRGESEWTTQDEHKCRVLTEQPTLFAEIQDQDVRFFYRR